MQYLFTNKLYALIFAFPQGTKPIEPAECRCMHSKLDKTYHSIYYNHLLPIWVVIGEREGILIL